MWQFAGAGAFGGLLVLCGMAGGVWLYGLVLHSRPGWQSPATQASCPSPQMFGDTFDVWRLVKISQREAAQCIRRANRLGFDLVQYMTDQTTGITYILFQLTPYRRLGQAAASA